MTQIMIAVFIFILWSGTTVFVCLWHGKRCYTNGRVDERDARLAQETAEDLERRREQALECERTGRLLVDMRKAQGLTTEDVAKQFKCSPKFIEHIESGTAVLTHGTAVSLEHFYGVPPGLLTRGVRKRKRQGTSNG